MLKTEGIIFRITRFKESSLILDIFTEQQGLQSFIVNGVFSKSNQRLASLLQLMNVVELIAYFREGKELHRITEVNPVIIYKSIPFDIKRSAIGIFILEICRNSIKDYHANVNLFKFIKQTFEAIDEAVDLDPYLHFNFLLDFANLLGFKPLGNYSTENNAFDVLSGTFGPYHSNSTHQINPKESLVLSQFIQNFPPETFILDLTVKRKLLQNLILLFKYHIDSFKDIKSIEVFKEII